MYYIKSKRSFNLRQKPVRPRGLLPWSESKKPISQHLSYQTLRFNFFQDKQPISAELTRNYGEVKIHVYAPGKSGFRKGVS